MVQPLGLYVWLAHVVRLGQSAVERFCPLGCGVGWARDAQKREIKFLDDVADFWCNSKCEIKPTNVIIDSRRDIHDISVNRV